MNPLDNVWSGIMQRRLLPVVILLVAALVAIPFVLAKDPEPAAPAAPAADSSSSEDAVADPVVTLAEAGGSAPARRRVLGASKNPFQPARAPKAAASAEESQTVTSATTQTAAQGADKAVEDTGSTGGASQPGAAAPQTPTDATPGEKDEPAPPAELYSLTVRFGSTDSDALEKRNLPRLKALPSAEDPILVYLGPGKGGKTAIFMVDESVEAQGDGVCQPTPRDCETIHMQPGDTEFFDVTGEDGSVTAQYQLDVLKIKTSKASAAKAASARAKVSKAGQSVLRAREAAVGPLRYRYEAKSGLVRKLDKRAYKALLAKSARIALGTAGGF